MLSTRIAREEGGRVVRWARSEGMVRAGCGEVERRSWTEVVGERERGVVGVPRREVVVREIRRRDVFGRVGRRVASWERKWVPTLPTPGGLLGFAWKDFWEWGEVGLFVFFGEICVLTWIFE